MVGMAQPGDTKYDTFTYHNPDANAYQDSHVHANGYRNADSDRDSIGGGHERLAET